MDYYEDNGEHTERWADSMKSDDLNQNKKEPAQTNLQARIIEWLVKLKVTNGIKNIHFLIMWIMVALFIFLSYFVYRSFYDVYVIFLFAPLIYSAIVYRFKGAIFGGIVFVGVLVPHALPLSLDTYVLVRSFIYLIFPFLVGSLVAVSLNYFEHQIEGYRKIVALNETLNSYIDRLEKTQKQLIQVEKMNALGQLSASIAHEINNPLAGVLVYTQLLQKLIKSGSMKPDNALEILAKMELALNHSSRLVRNLLDFARQSAPDLKPVEVSQVIDQAISLVGHQAQMNKVEVIRDELPALPSVKGDFSQLLQVFINLIVNAIQAMPDGGELEILSSSADNNFITVSIRDTGYGIPAENMDKLFTPFFSTKDAVKGVGLGLAVSYGIIERHGGRIEVRSEAGKGSVFTVYLPAYHEGSQKPGSPATKTAG
jgi:signal transduction histidine kinase